MELERKHVGNGCCVDAVTGAVRGERMIEPMHLYPEEKKRMQEAEKQGLSVMTCNNWLCPFNNDGYCVEPTKGDICGIYGDEDFNKYLDVVYDENYSDDFRDSVRRVMIARWGKKEQRLIYADAIEKVLEEKHFKRVLDSDRWLIADIKKALWTYQPLTQFR